VSRRALRLLALAAALAGGCAEGGSDAALRAVLDDERRAHLETDVALLVSHLADSLVSVERGSITVQSRAEVQAMFTAYFEGARYFEWDDVEPPRLRVSPGRRTAWVSRHVRVDREEPALGGARARRQFESAWTATYEWHGGWKMTSVTSTFVPPLTAAERVLASARRAVGGEVVDAVLARAEATGAGRGFEVEVLSARDGRVRAAWGSDFAAGIGSASRWTSSRGARDTLDGATETFVRGHEIHAIVLWPTTRFGPLEPRGADVFAGRAAVRLAGVDALGAPVDLWFAAADSLPLGMRVAGHRRAGEPPVVIEWSDWRPVGTGRLPHACTFRQAGDVFRYRFTRVDVSPDPTEMGFEGPGRAD
jgi:hypothetical protein